MIKDTNYLNLTVKVMRLPVHRLAIDEITEGMDYVGLVDMPAHSKIYTTMATQTKKAIVKQVFNSEKQIVTGVVIATNHLIYRRNDDGYEYNVFISKQDSLEIMKKFAKFGYHNNVNLMHDAGRKVKDAYLIESYFIREDKKNIPEGFKDQNLQPGSLVFSYWIEGKESWKFVKESSTGFSLEGWFKEVPVKFIKQKQKQMKKGRSLMALLGFALASVKVAYDSKKKYAEATNTDGETVQWDGELVEGVSVFIVPAEGDPVLAPEGDMTIDIDGTMTVVSVDEVGVVTNVEIVEVDPEDVAEAMTAMKAHYEGKFTKQESQLVLMAKTIDDLTVAFEKFSEKNPPKSKPSLVSGYASLRGKK